MSSESLRRMPSALALGAIERAARVEADARLALLEFGPNDHLRLVGWALATDPGTVFEKLFFVIDDTLWLPVPYGLPRDDVAAALRPSGRLRNAGFDVKFSTRHIRPGQHSLAVVGTIGDRVQQLENRVSFAVLIKPQEACDIAPRAEGRGRVRVVRDSAPAQRHDGRSPGAIRRGASLLVEGWMLAADAPRVPDEVRLLLVGPTRVYRVEVQRRAEPEASAMFGVDAVESGYRAFVDCADLAAGVYELWTETRLHDTWSASPTGRYVEIMDDTPYWLPSALPVYCAIPYAHFDIPLPESIAQDGELIVCGHVDTPAQPLGIFARIDGEQAFALTLQSRESLQGAACRSAFAGLLQLRLTLGEHILELVALDSSGSGSWRLARQAFSVLRRDLLDIGQNASRAVANH
jgi:hypothetical protein